MTDRFYGNTKAEDSGIKRFLLGIFLSRWSYLVVRVALALIFIYAGSMKLMDPKAFARIISHYDLVPEFLLPVVAIGLPLAEVLAGAALIFDMRPGLHGVSGMIVLFVIVLGYGVLTDMDIDCGCFGPEELEGRRSLAHAFYRDLVFLGAVVFLYWSRLTRNRCLSHESAKNIPK
ncbi:MAG: DoxX family membrane protein [Syntrophorhabdaceae bacterium]|nr:DoxX family membrane protein [Syntrophorhabdaceae bacterium]